MQIGKIKRERKRERGDKNQEREGKKTDRQIDRQSGRENWRQKCPYRSSIGRKLLLSEQQNGDRPIEQ